MCVFEICVVYTQTRAREAHTYTYTHTLFMCKNVKGFNNLKTL